MQLLPQIHLHTQVVVGEEAHRVIVFVVIVVRVFLVVWCHEAVRTYLESKDRQIRNLVTVNCKMPVLVQFDPLGSFSFSQAGKQV